MRSRIKLFIINLIILLIIFAFYIAFFGISSYWGWGYYLLYVILMLLALTPSAVLLYQLRKGIKEENGIIHFPFVFGNAKLIRSQIQGFDVERGFWERLGDFARLTIHNKDGQKITFLLPDYMIRDIVKNKNKILQS